MRRILIGLLVVFLLAGSAGGYLAFRRPAPGEAVEVVIEPGRSTIQIAETLAEQDVIGSVLGFRLMVRLRGLEGDLRAGAYELRRGMGVHAALDALSSGPVERSVMVTVPEGYTLKQVAARVGEGTHITEEEFLQAAGGGEIRSTIQPEDITSLEGFLYPDTYAVGERATAESLLRRMVGEFDRRTAELDWSVPEANGLSAYEALIVASLIEREAKVPEDREKISAVVYNRLEQGMRLEIDITALYDAPEHTVPTRRDLRRESPYNTYLIDGLPPTPIANPGIASIEAALAPAEIDAVFYVVIDPSGKHGFTADYQEFLRMKRLRPPEVRGG